MKTRKNDYNDRNDFSKNGLSFGADNESVDVHKLTAAGRVEKISFNNAQARELAAMLHTFLYFANKPEILAFYR